MFKQAKIKDIAELAIVTAMKPLDPPPIYPYHGMKPFKETCGPVTGLGLGGVTQRGT